MTDLGLIDKNKILEEKILFLLRGYIVPAIGGCIVLLVLVFIYYPNITGIIGDISTLSNDNQTYTQTKDRIAYFQSLASANRQLQLAENLIAINGVIPDEAKGADTITMIQSVAQQDGVTVVSANAQLLTSDQGGNASLSPLIRIVQVTVNVNGSADNTRKLFTDLNSMKQVAEVTDASIKGAVTGSAAGQVTFIVQVYALNSNDLVNGLNMLKPMNTAYTTDIINKL